MKSTVRHLLIASLGTLPLTLGTLPAGAASLPDTINIPGRESLPGEHHLRQRWPGAPADTAPPKPFKATAVQVGKP